MECEIIVVGAGPAGAVAATALAQQGHEVLLLDRQSFPRPKSCGDGVPVLAIEILDELGVGEKIRQAGFYPVHHIRLVSPGGYVLDTSQTGDKPGLYSYVAPRLDFDLLLQHIERLLDALSLLLSQLAQVMLGLLELDQGA